MKTVTQCRICGCTRSTPVVDLGHAPFADDFLTADRLEQPELHLPLKVVMCADCRLVQLTVVAPREALYQADYPYVSSTTDMGVRHYTDMAADIVARLGYVPPRALAVDIGSNVGVLTGGFEGRGMRALGVEPAPHIARMASLAGHETVNDFFSTALAQQVVATKGLAHVVTGTNVIAHIDDLHDLMRGLRVLLAREGLFVFEAPYLLDLLAQCAYDTVYHEHLSYLAVAPVQRLCADFGFEVVDVQPQRIHGGTLRYFIGYKNVWPVSHAVGRAVAREAEAVTPEAMADFADRVAAQRVDLCGLLHGLKKNGASIAAVSAPAKGMTLLSYCGIGRGVLDYVTEKAPLKVGKYTPGTHLPVLPDSVLAERQPDYALLLAWNFAEEIMRNLSRTYRGKFIVPVPHPAIAEAA